MKLSMPAKYMAAFKKLSILIRKFHRFINLVAKKKGKKF